MRIETKEIKIYKFHEASDELKDKIREVSFYDGGHFEHPFTERLATLKKFANLIDGNLDYCLSFVPDRGEYISIRPCGNILDFEAAEVFADAEEGDCPLTGVCYDEVLRDLLTKHRQEANFIQLALNDYIGSIHREYEYTLTDEYLIDLCDANDYEFTDDGKMY